MKDDEEKKNTEELLSIEFSTAENEMEFYNSDEYRQAKKCSCL
jgi:uncharacterized protein (DUF1330 family)